MACYYTAADPILVIDPKQAAKSVRNNGRFNEPARETCTGTAPMQKLPPIFYGKLGHCPGHAHQAGMIASSQAPMGGTFISI